MLMINSVSNVNLVDGGLSEWGAWQKCDKLCKKGAQQRSRTCTNPAPRCGGRSCDPKEKTVEIRDCYSCPGKSTA